MARIAFILLCHKDPDSIIGQVRSLRAAGDYVTLHFDRNGSSGDFAVLKEELGDDAGVVFAPRKRCGWGEWSLVDATLGALRTARKTFADASHFYLISGDCMPIKSARFCHAQLDEQDIDYIETVDFFTSGWIRTGFVEDRLIYRHIFNERTQKGLFYASLNLQRSLGLKRALPEDLQIRIGSQWWCLRRKTVDALLAFLAKRPRSRAFFRTTWIPDETFFQTLVHHLVPRVEIRSESPTFLMFSDYGMPVNFYNDHYGLLLGQRQFFARKISVQATDLKDKLTALYRAPREEFEITGEGRRLFDYVTSKGRVGKRFGAPAWQRGQALSADLTLLVVVCKKWHVARRFVDLAGQWTNAPSVDYLFDQEDLGLPQLGGIGTTLAKRRRHARTVVAMLFDAFETDRLVICLDPSHLDMMQDFADGGCDTRFLEIDCVFSPDYLAGHAQRLGLLSPGIGPEIAAHVLPTVHDDVRSEVHAMRAEGFSGYHRLSQTGQVAENTASVAAFLALPEAAAREIALNETMFAD